ALGGILYECLTGRPPFKADTPLATLQQVVAEDPVPPRRQRPGVPRDLETVCLKCMEKDPQRRYTSAAELADDLARFAAGRPGRARPLPRGGRLLKWARRRPAAAALAVLCLLGVLFLAGGAAWFTAHWQDTLERRTAQLQAEQQRRQAQREREVRQRN